MKVLETDRLVLRWLAVEDADFILALVNDPAWLRFIGDKGVHTLADARNYLLSGPIAMYRRFGFGLNLVSRKPDGASIGICGLIKRDSLEDVDIGFAFLPTYRVQGYAREAAAATIAHGTRTFGLQRIVAIATPENAASIKLLNNIGFNFEKLIKMSGSEADTALLAWMA
jgi:[ribosomal protein S5]-alanine N-acetyltransferase